MTMTDLYHGGRLPPELEGRLLGDNPYRETPAAHAGAETVRLRQLLRQIAYPVANDAPRIADMSEAKFLSDVRQYAEKQRWLCYHTFDSRRSPAGFPDLVLVRGSRLIFAELKREGENPTQDQRLWLQALSAVGTPIETYVWRPSDWPQIAEILAMLAEGRFNMLPSGLEE